MGFGNGFINHSQQGNIAVNAEGKRVKAVVNEGQVAHLWAHQAQSTARNGRGNFYFEGATIYSYGSHFPTGHLLNEREVLLNDSKWPGPTTAGHKQMTSGAVSHLNRFYVPELDELLVIMRMSGSGHNAGYKAEKVRRYVESHGADIVPGSNDFAAIAKALGLRRDSLQKMIRVEQQRREKLKAHRAKTDAKLLLAKGREVANLLDSAWQAMFNGIVESPDTLAINTKHFARIHKASGKLSKGQRAKLWARLKQLRETKALAQWRADLSYNRKAVRQQVKALRSFADLVDLADMDKRNWQALHDSARAIRERGDGISAKLRAYLIGTERFALHIVDGFERAERLAAIERTKEKRAAWLRGESIGYEYGRYSWRTEAGGALIRATGVERDASGAIIGGTLETAQGVTVPLVHAVKAFRFVKLVRESGKGWQRNGSTVRVGHYQVDSINPDGGFIAGCHQFDWPEIERLAKSLGVFDIAPSAEAKESNHA